MRQHKKAFIAAPENRDYFALEPAASVGNAWKKLMGSLSQASQQGLSERFDSSIGAASVLMPYGGHFQKTRTEGWRPNCRYGKVIRIQSVL